jgi:hypothetical protein
MLNFHENRVAFKRQRLLTGCDCSACETQEFNKDDYPMWQRVAFLVSILIIVLIGSCSIVHAYTDDQIVDAIRKAEGTWTYGIKSVSCQTEKECRQICKNTVRNNYKRWSQAGRKNAQGQTITYLQFLANRYCPIGASNDPTGLNRNWLRNVTYFLSKG